MTQPSQPRQRATAFTRIELAATLGALALICAVAMPLIGATRAESARIGCFGNLRQIGAAARLWGDDHADRLPWVTPQAEGGTRPETVTKAANAWVEFITLSNELVTPRILACPTDVTTKVASDWGTTANGFANSGFRGQALSYFINFHGQPELPRSVVAGDRDLRPTSASATGCGFGNILNAAAFSGSSGTVIQWTNLVHYGAGHLLFVDGSVEYVSSPQLRSALVGEGDIASDNPITHIVNAR